VVVHSNTIVDPWAVVVKALNALLADAAMAGAISAHNLAVSAEQYRIKDLHHFHEGDTFRTLEMTGVLAHGQ